MSYYLCLAVPQGAAEALPGAFGESVRLTAASGWPIANAARGQNASWSAYLLEIGVGSGRLIGKGSVRRTHNNDRSAVLVTGIQTLLAGEDCPVVAFLFHWMHGYIATEMVSAKREERLAESELSQRVPVLEEDVRYLVSPE